MQTETGSIMDFARQIVPNINKSSSSLGKLVEESPTQTALWKKDKSRAEQNQNVFLSQLLLSASRERQRQP